jgi:LmbE family N-acetylglucosaminyl deacetylase
MLIVTDGSKGTWDENLEAERLIQIREEEQRQSAEVLGARGEIVHLGYVDGELEYSMELRRQICSWIRKLRPNIVLGHDPWRRYMLHPDHRVAGFGAIDGVVAARDHLFFPDLGDKHRPDAILLWGADQPDYWEDISARFDQKIEALLCHSSQTITSMSDANAGQSGREAFERRMLEWAASQGSAVGLPFAESFKLLRP